MIVLQNIQIGYDGCTVASGVGNIAFAKAKFITVIGANGSGKSTLLRSIANGEQLLKGTITLNGQPLANISLQERARSIAILTTDRSLSKSITVQQLLEISRAPYTNLLGKLAAGDFKVINSIKTQFELEKLAHRQLSTLSDGQLQRALIARALVQETDYILMDEPTSHLDVHHRAELLIKLRNYCKQQQRTIIFSTHEIAMATALADQVVYFNDQHIRFKTTAQFKEKNILQQLFPSPYLDWSDGNYRLRKNDE